METLVTIVMCVYNTEKYLREAIESILNQTYKNLEFIIIDDGSTDSSSKIIESYDDDRIVFVKNDTNRGLPYSRNKSLDLSNGEFIAFMDSDDISKNYRIEKQVNFLKNHDEFVVVSSAVDKMINGKVYKYRKKSLKVKNINSDLMFYCAVNNPTVIIRADFFKKNNIRYDKECFVGEDYMLWIECCKKGGNIAYLQEALVIYRTGHNNITRQSITQKGKERKYIMDKIRTKCLINNGILLENNELDLFNKIFSDPMIDISINDITNYKHLIPKIVSMNKYEDKRVFSDKIKQILVSRIINLDCTKIEKLRIINFKIKNESILSYLKALIKITILR